MSNTPISVSKLLSKSRRNQENYKSLRANLEFVGGSEQVLLITSSIPGEGKSYVSINLASAIADSGKKVILLDCDLRKSQYTKKLNLRLKDRDGISEILRGKEKLMSCIHPSDHENLDILFSGISPKNPTELLHSNHFVEILEQCKEMYDYIVIDSAPIASVIDSAVICKYCDGIVFVIGSDMVSCRIAEKSIRQLERAGGKILGCTLNKIKMSNRALYGTYGTNKYFYGHYNGEYVDHGDNV